MINWNQQIQGKKEEEDKEDEKDTWTDSGGLPALEQYFGRCGRETALPERNIFRKI